MKKLLQDRRRLQQAVEPPVVGCNINVAVGRGDSTDQQCSFLMNSKVETELDDCISCQHLILWFLTEIVKGLKMIAGI